MSPLAKIVLAAFIVSGALLAGCKTAPIYEVVAQPLPLPTGKDASLPEIEKAMIRGGSRAGWQVSPEGPGKASARYTQGAHTATVGIEYDTKAYSIKMRETSVRSDGTSVHRAYNQWVQNLDRSIRVELSTLGQ